MEGDGHIVSMVDVLQEDNELEEEAAAVLGDSDDKCCTYPVGYVKRQALYACMTCRSGNPSPAGICLACSYECHEGHEFVELYTKRNFRCDCGNSKFPNLSCKLIKIKQPENSENQYNQNFEGVYCTCKRPYPDPEDEIEDEMIQCIICEDWYHGRHLGLTKSIPESDLYQEMVCEACMAKCDFLWNYKVHSLETKVLKTEATSDVDVTSIAEDEKSHTTSSQATTSPPGSSLTGPGDDTASSSQKVTTADVESHATSSATSSSPSAPRGAESSQSHVGEGVMRDEVCSNSTVACNSMPQEGVATSDTTISSSSTAAGGVPDESATTSVATTVATLATVNTDMEIVSSSTSSQSNHGALEVAGSGNNKPEDSIAATCDSSNSSSEALSELVPALSRAEVKEGNVSDSNVATTTTTTTTTAPHHATTLLTSTQSDNVSAVLSNNLATTSSESMKKDTGKGKNMFPPPEEEECKESTSSSTSDVAVKVMNGKEEQGTAQVEQAGTDACSMKQLGSRVVVRETGAVFWPMGWRSKLCSCAECKDMYSRLQVAFLVDPGDSVAAYEERGKGKGKRSRYDQGMEALSNMDRVQQVEMLHGYQDMKSALRDFLKSFAEQGKVVTAADIQDFYDNLNRKRQRVGSASTVQYLCR